MHFGTPTSVIYYWTSYFRTNVNEGESKFPSVCCGKKSQSTITLAEILVLKNRNVNSYISGFSPCGWPTVQGSPSEMPFQHWPYTNILVTVNNFYVLTKLSKNINWLIVKCEIECKSGFFINNIITSRSYLYIYIYIINYSIDWTMVFIGVGTPCCLVITWRLKRKLKTNFPAYFDKWFS